MPSTPSIRVQIPLKSSLQFLYVSLELRKRVCLAFIFLKMGHPRHLYRFLVSSKIITIFSTIYVKKCPSSIQYRDSNPRPLGRESPHITTRPGLYILIPFVLFQLYSASQASFEASVLKAGPKYPVPTSGVDRTTRSNASCFTMKRPTGIEQRPFASARDKNYKTFFALNDGYS